MDAINAITPSTNTGPWSVSRMFAFLNPASLKVLAEVGTPTQVRPTMAGAHLADVTDPQHRALRTAADHGIVKRGGPDGESVATLKALARKGYLHLVMRPGRRYDVDHAVITGPGERELNRLDAATTRRTQQTRTLARLAAA